MGLMGFTNLAHGSIVMFGGYLVVALMKSFGWPFLATIPAAFVVCALVGAAFERLLFRRLYAAGELNQVLLTIGLVFMSVAIATYLWGQAATPPEPAISTRACPLACSRSVHTACSCFWWVAR